MRHPTTGLSQDDLSRLTGSSSSTTSSGNHSNLSSSTSSSSSTSPNTPNAPKPDPDTNSNNTNNSNSTSSGKPAESGKSKAQQQKSHSKSYLPEFINPLEWQKSRKRKERLDSTSSVTQDRKLQRSNSEEILPQEPAHIEPPAPQKDSKAEVIRRVSSEDFKKTHSAYEQELKDVVESETENDRSLANRNAAQQQPHESLSAIYRQTCVHAPTKDMTRRYRYETSPARSQRHSPVRGNSKYRERTSDRGDRGDGGEDSECEHERRRSSERFCKSRAPPGRRAAGVTKKRQDSAAANGGKYRRSGSEENVYKYDLAALKSERRGFISKKPSGANVVTVGTLSDHNDNNLIDFHQQLRGSTPVSPTPSSCGSDITVVAAPIGTSSNGGENSSSSSSSNLAAGNKRRNNTPNISVQEQLPWERPVPEDQVPVLSRRYAAARHHPSDNLDTAAKLSKVMPYPQPCYKKQTAVQMYEEELDGLEPLNMFRGFTSLESLRTRDLMEQVIPAMMSSQSPEERLKHINKRLTAMKKKLAQLEEGWEVRMGYRPSQAERLNDKAMKNVLAELSKLRKERHELKTDTVLALGLKMSGDMDGAKKLEKMKATLSEIEQNLAEQREDACRSENLDDLTPDQLVQEKSAVQHRLLYFESMFGRPCSKEERDAARPLYDRYRQLKRMVSRSVLISGSCGAPELPTILEHEAMVFEFTPHQYSSNNSTESSNSPTTTTTSGETTANLGNSTSTAAASASDDSTTTTTATPPLATNGGAGGEGPAGTVSENISDLSIEELWKHLDKVREEKKLLKRTIREYEAVFEEQNGRKMLKSDRRTIEETYAQYKEKKAKTRLLQALIKKHNNSR